MAGPSKHPLPEANYLGHVLAYELKSRSKFDSLQYQCTNVEPGINLFCNPTGFPLNMAMFSRGVEFVNDRGIYGFCS